MFNGAEIWTLRSEGKERLHTMEKWISIRMEEMKWEDRAQNEEVMRRLGEFRELLNTKRRRKMN